MRGCAHHGAQAVKLCTVCASPMHTTCASLHPRAPKPGTVFQLCCGPDWDEKQQRTARQPDLNRTPWKKMKFLCCSRFLILSKFLYYSGSFNPFSRWQNILVILLICTEGQLHASEPVEYILCQGQSASISQNVCTAAFSWDSGSAGNTCIRFHYYVPPKS